MRNGLAMSMHPEAVSHPRTSASPNPRAFIGISGYDYKGWRGRFYPDDLDLGGRQLTDVIAEMNALHQRALLNS